MSEQHLRLFVVGNDGPQEIDADRARLYVDEEGISPDEGGDCQACRPPTLVERILGFVGVVLRVVTSLPVLALLAGAVAAAVMED